VLITVSDITRGWQRNDLLLPTLLDYLNDAGIRDDDVTIVIAVGAHD
jgi:nickel-dependent lactate racemase